MCKPILVLILLALSSPAYAEEFGCFHLKTSVNTQCDTSCACLSIKDLAGAQLYKDSESENSTLTLSNGDVIKQSNVEMISNYVDGLSSNALTQLSDNDESGGAAYKSITDNEFRELYTRGVEIGLETPVQELSDTQQLDLKNGYDFWAKSNVTCKIAEYLSEHISGGYYAELNKFKIRAHQAKLYASLTGYDVAQLTCNGIRLDSLVKSITDDYLSGIDCSELNTSDPSQTAECELRKQQIQERYNRIWSDLAHVEIDAVEKAHDQNEASAADQKITQFGSVNGTIQNLTIFLGAIRLDLFRDTRCQEHDVHNALFHSLDRFIKYQMRSELFMQGSNCRVVIHFTINKNSSKEPFGASLKSFLEDRLCRVKFINGQMSVDEKCALAKSKNLLKFEPIGHVPR